MAFRATRKTASPKSQPTETPTTEVAPGASFSVDDLVGGPPPAGEATAPIAPETPVQVLVQTPPPTPQPASAETPYVRPASTYGERNGGRNENFGQNRPYTPRPRYGNDQRRPYNPGSMNRPMGARRDFAPVGGNPQMQDINVPTETVKGILDVMPEGHGFLRPKFTPSDRDVYISQSQIRRFLLRNGDMVEGQARAPKENERYYGLLKVETVNGRGADTIQTRPKFEDLIPVYPNKLLKLETGTLPLSTRILDLIAPIGFGQRGLIVSPPKAGKTTILKEIASGIAANFPSVHLMAALIGERPEEVTDLSRNIKGEVLASNFDESPQEQTRVAEVALDRAKRLVEMGEDVVILLDSITRLARAYNLVVNPSGRTLSGGFDPAALYPAKKFLGAARCVEPVTGPGSNTPEGAEKPEDKSADPAIGRVTVGGSLTVIGTALVETGSRMDDLIYEEFKGTGNMELHLSRVLQERRVFPAIDIAKSGTRHDELLLGEEAMKRITTLRHMLSMLSDDERTMVMVDRLSKVKSNAEFLESLAKGS